MCFAARAQTGYTIGISRNMTGCLKFDEIPVKRHMQWSTQLPLKEMLFISKCQREEGTS